MKVQITITEQVRHDAIVEMTKDQFDSWCKRIDSARGFRREEVAQELMDVAGIDTRNGDYSDTEVENFDEVSDEEAAAV